MNSIGNLENSVRKLLEDVEIGEKDPLAIKLVESYKSLRRTEAEIDRRVSVDEALNTLLESKTARIQEMARILASPEVYVNKIRMLKPMRLAKLISYRHPITFPHLKVGRMQESFSRIRNMIEARKESFFQEEEPPSVTEPQDKTMEMENSITLDEMRQFLEKIPKGQAVALKELLVSPSMDIFLRRFLCVVLLISKGMLNYDGETVTRSEMQNDE